MKLRTAESYLEGLYKDGSYGMDDLVKAIRTAQREAIEAAAEVATTIQACDVSNDSSAEYDIVFVPRQKHC